MSSPSISIAMATYNGAAHLAEQLQSIADQTYYPIELQIGDDGSTDATEVIVRDFARDAPFPVHFHRNDRPLGYGENFIRTAHRCRGNWIAFCDQDDVWRPDKLSRCAEEIISTPSDTVLVVHDAEIVGEALQRSRRKLYGFRAASSCPPLFQPPEWYALGLTQVFRSDLLRDLPCSRRVNFPWHQHREAHDVWISLVANITGSIRFVPDTLVEYRRHGHTATATASDGEVPTSLLAGHGINFRERSAYLGEVADLLSACIEAAGPEFVQQLNNAIAQFRLQAKFLGLRADIYSNPTLQGRIQSLSQLLRSGGYFGNSGWPFGAARLVKDLFHAAIGPLLAH